MIVCDDLAIHLASTLLEKQLHLDSSKRIRIVIEPMQQAGGITTTDPYLTKNANCDVLVALNQTLCELETYSCLVGIPTVYTPILTILCHEFIHVQQCLTGRIKFNSDNNVIWKPDANSEVLFDMSNVNTLSHAAITLPWEIEAYSGQQALASEISKQIKVIANKHGLNLGEHIYGRV